MATNQSIIGAVGGTGVAGAADPEHEHREMTSHQADVLRALCEKTGESFDPSLSEQAAETRIAELEEKVGEDVDGDGQVGDDGFLPKATPTVPRA
ncbi:MAG: hypothetical protein ACU0DW_05570 [Shimia sp.]